MNVKLLATENILVFEIKYKYKKTFLTQSTGDLSVESEWCIKVFIEDIKLRHLAHILSSVLEKKKACSHWYPAQSAYPIS